MKKIKIRSDSRIKICRALKHFENPWYRFLKGLLSVGFKMKPLRMTKTMLRKNQLTFFCKIFLAFSCKV